MDDAIDRELLIKEIRVLEQAINNTGGSTIDVDDAQLKAMSIQDLRGFRDRLQRLARSLGGVRNV
jgi:hypothetical protein